jgi:GntR family transcriptional regulator/MocR family aminotransferase
LRALKSWLQRSRFEQRFYCDRQGDQSLEYALAELFRDGDVQRHIRRARRVYQSRRDLLAAE